MKSYVIRNARPLGTVTLYGRTLAPASVGGRTNTMFLSEAELLGGPCVDLLRAGRIELVRGTPPESLRVLLAGGVLPSTAPLDPEVASAATDLVSDSISEPVEVEQIAPEPVVAAEPVSVVEVVAEPEAPPKRTAEDLKAFTVVELRKIARGYKLKTSGSEDDLIQRILDHETGVTDV